jgi:hypothetical protein
MLLRITIMITNILVIQHFLVFVLYLKVLYSVDLSLQKFHFIILFNNFRRCASVR